MAVAIAAAAAMPAIPCCNTRGTASCFGGSTGPSDPLSLPRRLLPPGPWLTNGHLPFGPLLGQGPLS
eukprot:3287289-Alexandrium_andersonii.AAC.1